mgnify:CR=1 FL=1
MIPRDRIGRAGCINDGNGSFYHHKSVVSCVNRGVRYITLSYEGSHEGMDGIAHCVCARPPINLRSTGRPAGTRMRLPRAGLGQVSTLKHSLSIDFVMPEMAAERPNTAIKPLKSHPAY